MCGSTADIHIQSATAEIRRGKKERRRRKKHPQDENIFHRATTMSGQNGEVGKRALTV